jgi:hypothetical protein
MALFFLTVGAFMGGPLPRSWAFLGLPSAAEWARAVEYPGDNLAPDRSRSETQRQHARYKLPLKVFFKGKLWLGSPTGRWAVSGSSASTPSERRHSSTPSGSSSPTVSLCSRSREIRYVDAANRRMGVRMSA